MLPPPEDLPDRAPRLAKGRYVLLARIGRGGMAGVYGAWDTQVSEWRAIKVLLPKHARDGGLRARFEREGITMQALQHPNLVRLYEVGEGEKLPFLVMELVDGGSLYHWTKEHGLMPPCMAIEAMLQLCAGVSCVHAAGVVHRDIKPRNVLVNSDGVLKLTDFGIAQWDNSTDTRTGLAMGTLGFMSPEQLHDAKSVDGRTDVYAIGATMWSQLTGKRPRDLFRFDDQPELLQGVPAPLCDLLAHALAYEREQRLPSVEALAVALTDCLEALPPDPADTPPLAINMGPLSLKTQLDHTFAEILTTGGEECSRGSEAPQQRRDPFAEDTSVPSYLRGVEQPKNPRTFAGTNPEPTQVARTWLSRLAVLVVLAPLVTGLVAVAMLSVFVGIGAQQVNGAAERLTRSQAELSASLRRADPLPGELVALGSEPGPIVGAFEAWSNAAGEPERTDAAVEFVLLAEQELRVRLPPADTRHEARVVRQRLDRLRRIRDELVASERGLLAAAATPHGRLSVAIGLAELPP